MARTPDELKKMLERFEAVIRGAGVKLTPQRIAIYREVARTADHPDIETVFRNVRRRLPSVSLDTIYRTLGLFAELGLVTTVRPQGYRVRFDANTSPHHHFVCTGCGRTRDFLAPDLNALPIPESARALGRVDSAHVEVRGLCPACATGPGSPKGKSAKRRNGTRSRRDNINTSRRDGHGR